MALGLHQALQLHRARDLSLVRVLAMQQLDHWLSQLGPAATLDSSSRASIPQQGTAGWQMLTPPPPVFVLARAPLYVQRQKQHIRNELSECIKQRDALRGEQRALRDDLTNSRIPGLRQFDQVEARAQEIEASTGCWVVVSQDQLRGTSKGGKQECARWPRLPPLGHCTACACCWHVCI